MTPEEQKVFDETREEELKKVNGEKQNIRMEQIKQAAKESVSVKAKVKAIGSTLMETGNMFAQKMKPIGEQLGGIQLNKPLPDKKGKKEVNPYFPEM